MAAVFTFVALSSILFVRVRQLDQAPVAVQGRGEPASPPPEAVKPKRNLDEDERFNMTGAKGGSPRGFDEGAQGDPPAAARATSESEPSLAPEGGDGRDGKDDLATAEALRKQGGCPAAIPKLREVAKRYPNGLTGATAQQILEACARESYSGPAQPGSSESSAVGRPGASATQGAGSASAP